VTTSRRKTASRKMQWFKHHNNFRNTPAMRMIADYLGDKGVAAAYRLFEVMCEQCGSGEDFKPTLILIPPRDLSWLGRELLLPTEDETYGIGTLPATDEETQKVLNVFAKAGLIIQEKAMVRRGFRDGAGNITTREVPFDSITVPGLVENVDEWTQRKRTAISKAMAHSGKKKVTLGTPK
jgi:hypothetical protein